MTNVVVWDAEGVPSQGDWMTVIWRGFSDGVSPKTISIPALIESNAEVLRARYLAWVYELGETHIRGRRLVEHLELRPGFSFWWMSLFVEKCNYSKSPQIEDAIRLMAFTDWAVEHAVTRITLASPSQPIADCMRLWCSSRGVAFDWQRQPKPSVNFSWIRRAYLALPSAIQGLIWLFRYFIERWPLRGAGLKEWQESESRITFFSYSDNCAPEAVNEGVYANGYWAHLPDTLRQESQKTNWLHLYVKDSVFPTATKAAEAIRAINRTEIGRQCHATLDTFLGLNVVIRTLRNWIRLVYIGVKLSGELGYENHGSLNLWPLFCEDWRKSMFGTVAMSNILSLNLFEKALACIPKQNYGVYLQENQGWEFGLICTWQAAGHRHLIGTPHSTVRFWDLRYFFDPRSYLRKGVLDLPLPNLVACNGPVMMDIYSDGGYPKNYLVNVEALRYLYLDNSKIQSTSDQNIRNVALRLLVLGEYLKGNTQKQMQLLVQAAPLISIPIIITVKPHPNCPISTKDYPALSMRVSMDSIETLLAECDIAYSSAVTSAAVDAYCAGIPVVSILYPDTLNLSPLRGCPDAVFVRTPEELALALMTGVATVSALNNRKEFFTTDSKLPRWRQLLLECE